MSYLFDGSGDSLRGQFGTTYNSVPITLACFLKVDNHPVAADCFVNLGEAINSIDHSQLIRTDLVDDSWEGITDGGATSSTVTLGGVNIDAASIGTTYNATTGWAGIVGVFTNDSLRDLYVAALANTAQNTGTKPVNNTLAYIAVGEALSGAQDFTGRIAEVAIWNAALNSSQITSYLGGGSASQIASANLIGYWPLSASNATQSNDGVDTAGDLTVAGAVFSSDHPTITLAGSAARSSKKRLMMGVA
jgi:hypothetical protein